MIWNICFWDLKNTSKFLNKSYLFRKEGFECTKAKEYTVLIDILCIKDFFGYEDGIESVILKKGCVAVLYKDVDCTSDPFTLKAETNKDLIIKELSESTAKDYGKSISFIYSWFIELLFLLHSHPTTWVSKKLCLGKDFTPGSSWPVERSLCLGIHNLSLETNFIIFSLSYLGAIFILHKEIGVGGWSRKCQFSLTLCSKDILR